MNSPSTPIPLQPLRVDPHSTPDSAEIESDYVPRIPHDQVVPSSSWNGDGLHQAAFQAQGFLEWEFPPDPNSTHHLIFNSVSGFLQRWPNTFRRNGALESLQTHRLWQPGAC
jgi:hypothetical protein